MDLTNVWVRIQYVGYLFWDIILLFGVVISTYGEMLYRVFVPRPMKSLKDEIILLTGSGNGIGKQLAMELANVGATLVCWDNEAEANARTVTELKRKGTKAFGYTVDISERENIVRAAAQVREDVGDVTIIINNAGIAPTGPFLEMKESIIEKVFQVNILSHIWILRQFMPRMIERGRGHIVTTASIVAYVPAKGLAAYTSSKHAVTGFIDSFRQEIWEQPGKPDIKFTTVYPVLVATRLWQGSTFKQKYDAVPIMTPEYVAKRIVEGFRRNYEYLFLPPTAIFLAYLSFFIPHIIQKQLHMGLFETFIMKETMVKTKKTK